VNYASSALWWRGSKLVAYLAIFPAPKSQKQSGYGQYEVLGFRIFSADEIKVYCNNQTSVVGIFGQKFVWLVPTSVALRLALQGGLFKKPPKIEK